NAEFRIMPDLPAWLQIGFFRPGAVYRATVRLSNASGKIQPDARGDLRGVALRIHTGEGAVQDFLMTNAPASHARDARQFMVVARALAPRTPLLTPVLLLCGLGFRETLRVLGVLRRDSS